MPGDKERNGGGANGKLQKRVHRIYDRLSGT